MNFGERIIYLREIKGYSQADLASLLETTPQSLVRYEKNKTKPSYELICKLHSLIDGINGDWLISGIGEPFSTNKKINVGFINNDTDDTLELPPYFIEMLGGNDNIKNIDAINIIGDSMEPTFTHNNILFVDKIKTDIEKEDGIYAFTTNHGLFVKRLQQRVDGKIDIISDNKEYPSQVLDKSDINIIGKIVSFFSNLN